MSTEKAPAPQPAVGTTKITITLPNDLLAVLDDAAALDNRTRANFIAYMLRCLKQENPFLGDTRPPCAKFLSKQIPGPSAPCPRGHLRPCERNRQPTPNPS